MIGLPNKNDNLNMQHLLQKRKAQREVKNIHVYIYLKISKVIKITCDD